MTEYNQLNKTYFDIATAPVNAKKAGITIGAGENGSVAINYDILSTEGNSYTITIAEGVGVDTAMSATLTGKDVLLTLGTTPATKASINIGSDVLNGGCIITADATGVAGNDFTVTVSDAGANDCAMSAALVGNDITVVLGKTVAALEPTKNTAILVAAEIAALEGVTAIHTGTGATPLTVAIAQTNLTGGSAGGAVSTPKNTATLIATAINALTDITAIKTGTGADSITAAVAEASFSGGQYATISMSPTIIISGGSWYICDAPVDKWEVAGWYIGTPALIT